ncbi:DUF4292 domain-containing protein [Pinibacter soli]|nr:DUF4292 domain-containing protein [Pinibacter soli]
MKFFSPLLLAAGIITIISCHSTRKINTALSKKDTTQMVVVKDIHNDSLDFIKQTLHALDSSRINFSTFSAKVKVDVWDKDGKKPDLTVFIRMKKDSIIWLSVNATVFSYEAYRIVITPDSVKMLNKQDKVVELRSVSYLQELSHLPLKFSTMQDLLVGNPIFVDSNVVSYKKNPDNVTMLIVGSLFKNLLTIKNNLNVVSNSKMDDVDPARNRTCNISYGNYEKWDSKNFPKFREISVVEKSKIDVQMDFKQYSFNEILSYPFSIPKNYKAQ